MSYPLHPSHPDSLPTHRQTIENCVSSISHFRSKAPSQLYRQHVRFATLRNQLFILAQHYDLQLADTGPLLPPGASSSGGIAWRLAADCFSVVISAIPADGYSLPPGTTPPEDYPVSVAAVHFEFNQDKPTECNVLVEDLRKRIYFSLWKHVKNLIALYNLPGEIAQRCRAYLCLQALEQDLIALTTAVSSRLPHRATPMSLELTGGSSVKVANTASDVECLAQSINGSAVGQMVPRTGGSFACLTYFISPSRKLTVLEEIRSRPPTGLKEGSECGMLDGYCASVGLRATTNGTQHSLPLVSLVNLIKDADGYSVAQFTTADNITRVTIAAEFFLKLNPPLLFDVDSIAEIEAITKISMDSVKQQEPLPLRYILLCQHNQEDLAAVDPTMTLPNMMQHTYHVLPNNLRGYLVNEIAFTCPSQLPPLIQILRQKASWLSFVETFMLHPRDPFPKDPELTYSFKVTLPSQKTIIVSFSHPCWDKRVVDVLIEIGHLGVSEARVNGATLPDFMRPQLAEADESLEDEGRYSPTAILSETHNLPVAMTWLLIRLGCPATRILTRLFPCKFRPSKNAKNSTKYTRKPQPLDNMLRALANFRLCNDAAADGIMAGADKLSDETLEEAKRLFLGDATEGIFYGPTVTATPSWPVALQSSQHPLPPPPPPPYQQIPPTRSLLPPGVMATTLSAGITSDQHPVLTPKQPPDDTFPSPAHASNNQSYRSIPLIPGVMTTSSTSSLYAQSSSMRPLVVSTPSNHALKPQTPASCGGSMLVSLLDEDTSPQSLPPPHVGTSTLPPNRILSSPAAAATPLPASPITATQQVSDSNHSSSHTPTYLKSPGSTDVLSHLLTSSGSGGSGNATSTASNTNNSTQSLSTSIKSITTTTDSAVAGASKKGRKRRTDTIGAFISTLPTRAVAIENTKQSPAKAIISKPSAALAKVSVYDFEDCPLSTNIVPPPPPPPPPQPLLSAQIPPKPPFEFNEVATAERTTEMKSSLKFVIKTNRAGLTAATTAVSNNPVDKASAVNKPRSKTVEGKPVAYLKQMQQQQPQTSTQHLKKDRKRRASSKNKEALQPSLVMSISSPRLLSTAQIPGIASPKKHGLSRNKSERKKTSTGGTSESKRHRLMTPEEPQQISSMETGPLGGSGNGTNRLIKGYKIPKVRKLSTSSTTNASPSLPPQQTLNNSQEDPALASAGPLAPPPPQPSTAGSGVISPTITKAPQRSLLHIVENLKRAAGGESVVQSQQQQKLSSNTITAYTDLIAPGVGTNSADDALPLGDSTDNLFEKFNSTATPNRGGSGASGSSTSSSMKKLKLTPPSGAHDSRDPSSSRPVDDSTGGMAENTESEALAIEGDDSNTDVIFSLGTHSDSQTPPASMDGESVTATGGLIKAPTDTPDSPTESMSNKAFVASSKIIPVTQESGAQQQPPPPLPPPPPPPPPSGHNSSTGVANAGPFYNKSLPPGRPASNAARGVMSRGAGGPRFNHLRGSSGWGNRPFNTPPMMPRGSGVGGGPGGGWGGPPGLPSPHGGGGNWGHPPPRSGAIPPPLYRGGPFGGGSGNRQPPPKN